MTRRVPARPVLRHPAQVIVVAFAAALGTTLLTESRPRSKHGIAIVGVKRTGEDFTHATPETLVEAGDIIIVSDPQASVERFSELA